MSYDEPTLKSDVIFNGKIVKLQVDEVRLPDGQTASREIVRHPGAVAVLPITEDNRLIVVEQYRKPLERMTAEIPAGKLDPGEDVLACAKRELQEETGFTSAKWSFLVSFFTSPGFADEQMHLYIAEDLIEGQAEPDADEFISMKAITLEEAYELIETQAICDAKTVTAVYAWQNRMLMSRG